MKMTRAKKLAAYVAVVITTLVGGVYGLRAWLMSGAEITETRMEIANLSGAQFQVTDTDYDALAKEEWVSIYVAAAGDSHFARLIHRKTLLFQYDPWSYDAAMPTITSLGPHRIQISVPRVSSIRFKRADWKNLSIDYKIGFVEYP
jgi:hypothetical protein